MSHEDLIYFLVCAPVAVAQVLFVWWLFHHEHRRRSLLSEAAREAEDREERENPDKWRSGFG